MKSIVNWVKGNPTRAAGISAVIIGWMGLILPDAFTTGLSTILGIVMGTTVWNAVTPVKKP